MWEIGTFIQQNAGQIVIGLVIAAVFFLLTPLWGYRVKNKEKQMNEAKVKEKILDILEEKIVSNQTISSSIISSLINSLERENTVTLDIDYDHVSILEDLELRFEKIKRPRDEKEKYTRKIERLIAAIEKENSEAEESRRPFSKIINSLEDFIKKGNKKESLKYLAILSNKIIGEPKEESLQGTSGRLLDLYLRVYKRNPLISIVVVISFIVTYYIMLKIMGLI